MFPNDVSSKFRDFEEWAPLSVFGQARLSYSFLDSFRARRHHLV